MAKFQSVILISLKARVSYVILSFFVVDTSKINEFKHRILWLRQT